MTAHIFTKHCINFEELLANDTLDSMLKTAFKQSKTEEAHKRVDYANYKDYDTNEWSPKYFGMFVEWLAWHFLNHYGHLFNVQALQMSDSIDSSEEDYGIDGRGVSIKSQLMQSTGRKANPGSPVFVQVKGTMNRTKEYQANDGSRLPNFGTNAMSEAIKTGYPTQARYIVFTTGAGLHYSLEKMTNKMFEVINYKKIKALVDSDTVFINRLRASVGLVELPVGLCQPDAESLYIQQQQDLEPAQ